MSGFNGHAADPNSGPPVFIPFIALAEGGDV